MTGTVARTLLECAFASRARRSLAQFRSGTRRQRDKFGTRCGVATLTIKRQEFHMDREHVKGTAKKIEGSVKETVGKVTGNKEKEAEGKLDKAEGSAHKVAGDVKDAVRHGTE
jgi:uncharacterized protein YjbJ (UPF0337 family)